MMSAVHPHEYLRGTTHPRVFAHRGLVTPEMRDEGIAENSVASIAAAHAAGVEYVESDCRMTSDGAVVLCHDADLTRIAGDPRRVADVELAELEDLLADRGGLATLGQALDAFPELRFNIDVKADAAAEVAGRITAPYADRVLLTSFSDARRRRALQAARVAGGRPASSGGRTVVIEALIASLLRPAGRVAASALRDVDALQIPERQGALGILSPRLLRTAHDHGVEVHVWTVNAPADMRRLVALGVDGIITDRADLALQTLRS
ncbi:glycerophosphodiester phosphodiesterase family protein [Microbacterium sp. G2-8]|uniref:glycerophosphodiester phosphodiesterase family protein n=1 Tax=Microbacterium sp. G2-8 TaxID=2842454 RepID=UPI001C899F40|nr:glycerophosphodiester phosphodiesterase family protein [Microbacterium sp. G2-8]